MTAPVVAELVDLLSLERLEDNLFRGQSRDIGTKYVFGGQVLGQALSAAQQTLAADRHVHSIHAYFLRPGRYDVPACTEHLRRPAGGDCMQHGCLARRACPVAPQLRYEPVHAAFHMRAFAERH